MKLTLISIRSNNRIQMFKRDGTFHFKFGTEGNRNGSCQLFIFIIEFNFRGSGQFNRPASVCVDGMGRLVVTDKDNHRMQVCQTFNLEISEHRAHSRYLCETVVGFHLGW